MTTRYPFYEVAARRRESDGAERRCYQAADQSSRALFVWYADVGPATTVTPQQVLQAQLLLGDETFVEWRAMTAVAGSTDRGLHPAARARGVRSLHATGDSRVLERARELLQSSDLPAPLVADLLASLPHS